MAYQKTTFRGINDALTKLKDFLFSDGWNILDFSNDEYKVQGYDFIGKRLHVSKNIGGSVKYFNFRSSDRNSVFDGINSYYDTYIGMNSSSGYSSSQEWYAQPGVPINTLTGKGFVCMSGKIGSGDCYFFSNNSVVTAVFANIYNGFKFFSFGVTENGEFCIPSGPDAWNLYMRESVPRRYSMAFKLYDGNLVVVDYSGHPGIKYLNDYVTSYDDNVNIITNFIRYGTNTSLGVVPLPPLSIFTADKERTGRIFRVGNIEGHHVVDGSIFPDAGEFTYGADTYMIFKYYNTREDTLCLAIKKNV